MSNALDSVRVTARRSSDGGLDLNIPGVDTVIGMRPARPETDDATWKGPLRPPQSDVQVVADGEAHAAPNVTVRPYGTIAVPKAEPAAAVEPAIRQRGVKVTRHFILPSDGATVVMRKAKGKDFMAIQEAVEDFDPAKLSATHPGKLPPEAMRFANALINLTAEIDGQPPGDIGELDIEDMIEMVKEFTALNFPKAAQPT